MNQIQTQDKPEANISQAEEKKVDQIIASKPDESSTSPQSEPESDKEINWKKWKEARARERAEAEQIRKRAEEKEREAEALKAAMEAILNKPQQQQKNYFEEEEESEEVRIERKVNEALKKAEAKRIQEEQQRELNELPQRLTRNNPDFHHVCTPENLDYLDYHYPEISAAFQHMPEGYAKWENIYKAVKKFVPNTQSNKEAVKAEKNLQKPVSMSSSIVNQAVPNANPVFLTEERRAANYERMKKIMNSLD